MRAAWRNRVLAVGLITVAIAACAAPQPSPTPEPTVVSRASPTPAPTVRPTSPVPPIGPVQSVWCSPEPIRPESPLTCDAAIEAARAVYDPIGPPWTRIEFYYGGYCRPTLRCAAVTVDHGYVVFRTSGGIDYVVEVLADADGVVTVDVGPEPFPPGTVGISPLGAEFPGGNI